MGTQNLGVLTSPPPTTSIRQIRVSSVVRQSWDHLPLVGTTVPSIFPDKLCYPGVLRVNGILSVAENANRKKKKNDCKHENIACTSVSVKSV